MIKEVRSYIVGLLLIVVCYVGGNLTVSLFWGITADFATWLGVPRALLSAAVGVGFYYAATEAIPFIEGRHAAIPPVIVGVAALSAYGIVAFSVSSQGGAFVRNVPELVAVLAAPLAWLGFGFWAANRL